MGGSATRAPAPSTQERPAAVDARPQRPLRLLIGLEGLALGGCPINALDLARVLRGRGHLVDVFAIDEEVTVSLLPYARRSGFDVTVLPQTAGLLARSAQIHRLAMGHRSDVIHVFAPWLAPSAAVAAARQPATRAVATNWTMENAFYTATTPMIVGTAALRREAVDRLSAPVWLLEPPIDVHADRPDAARAAAFRCEHGLGEQTLAVMVSRLDVAMKAEGIGHAIAAWGRLNPLDATLVVVGDGDAAAHLRAMGDEVNSNLGREAVRFTGALLDPRGAYSAADLALGMGGSALRALAHGCPLVVLGERGFARTFDEGSRSYFLEHGFYGVGGPDDAVAHLSDLLADLLQAPGRRRELGELGLREVRARFSLESAVDTLERVYADAMGRPSTAVGRLRVTGGALARQTRHVTGGRLRGLVGASLHGAR